MCCLVAASVVADIVSPPTVQLSAYPVIGAVPAYSGASHEIARSPSDSNSASRLRGASGADGTVTLAVTAALLPVELRATSAN